MTVNVIGAGLAGCEAAWQLAKQGVPVRLYDMKPSKMTPAHKSTDFSELVCSNSFRSDELSNACGLLKEELRRLDSLIMCSAEETRVKAGGALAVDRNAFSKAVTERIRNHPLIEVVSKEITEVSDQPTIIASGPLTSDSLAEAIIRLTGKEALHFYDAAAPVVTFESIDQNHAFFASRYLKGEGDDYVNCPMDKEQYESFIDELITAEEAPVHGFEDKMVFEGCMPVEVMARRGRDTLRFGPLKPVGLINPNTGKEPYAVVQLRRDNALGTVYNLVGFQTHLKFGEQKRVFSMIPALKNADFVRYGVMHRNSYLDSPRLLDPFYRLRTNPKLFFAGQITGVEGYIESTASGFYAGLSMGAIQRGNTPVAFPRETAIGALASYISDESIDKFQPMNINFGIITPLSYRVKGKREKNAAISERALKEIETIKNEINQRR
ncbi:MAG: methylenetetrahydrofolate--tRNA-(uracil(54)-C(5))-methyltransferase (FADH(2)-oxidizing) TrmFO [Clostridiales bacterium]|nr:methylenetetrahydrofolate--tRNA-(uracil(54)-C(5))-methyltransferase (FADH(2)-oxidizing) TrmFO [Clostridiales bacterium]